MDRSVLTPYRPVAQRHGTANWREDANVESSGSTLLELGSTQRAGAAAGALNDEVGDELGAELEQLAHTVVNVLHTITSAADLANLLIARGEAVKASGALTCIETECIRAARVLREASEFMTFAIHPGLGAVDIVALVNACAEAFDGRVEAVPDPALPAITGDVHGLRRAFMEILCNAFEFGASRVAVTLTATAEGNVRIEFHDDGRGVTTPASRLFELFYTTRPDEHSGLGLALAKRVVVAHGGFIGLGGAEGGASIVIELPLRGT